MRNGEFPEQVVVGFDQRQLDSITERVYGGVGNVQEILPLSEMQAGMLSHRLRSEEEDPYLLFNLFEFLSDSDLSLFVKGLQHAVDRHAALRCVILWEGLPKPVQVLLRSASLTVDEFASDPNVDLERHVAEWMRPGKERLDLTQAPLVRVEFTRKDERLYALIIRHHIVCDRQSWNIIISGVAEWMQRRELDPIPPSSGATEPVLVQPRDVAGPAATAFFRNKLADVDESTAPFGVFCSSEGTGHLEERHSLDLTLARQIRSLADRVGTFPAQLFHAIWTLVVARTSGRDDVVFGTVLTTAQGKRARIERAVGLFVNTVPLRLPIRRLSAEELVEKVKLELGQVARFAQMPLTAAIACSGANTAIPLFTSLLNYRHVASVPTGIREIAKREAVSGYPVALIVDDLGDGFDLTVQTHPTVDPSRVMRYVEMAARSLIQALEREPQRAAASLEVVPEREWRHLLGSLSGKSSPSQRSRLIHELFEEQVTRAPDAIAVTYRDRWLSYGELNRRANQLGSVLRREGVATDEPVGLCVERGLDLLIGLLGTLKAGGAYVPLDPNYPPDRLNYMVSDAAARVVLVGEGLADRVGLGAALTFDISTADIAQRNSANLAVSGQHANSLAYVIYTSGSTGRPKGVMVDHASVVNLWLGLESLYDQATECRRIALNASLNFDASVQQLVQLLSGRTLFLIPQEVRLDPSRMLRLFADHQIDGVDCTPTQLKAWIGAGLLSHSGSDLHVVFVGGEAIDSPLWSQLAEFEKTAFYNVYGPTECSVDTTAARITAEERSAHIGFAMLNRKIYLLDSSGNVAPQGVPGEICIGGIGVARGYWNRPALTAARFVADPFSADAHARMYRTGDIGRVRTDGAIEYLGRADGQVKIRGFRIELGEIEAQLTACSGVKEACALVREDVAGDKRIVAYVTLTGGDSAQANVGTALRSQLAAVLPSHMIPSAIMILERFPLTPTGKLDCHSFPPPEVDTDEDQSDGPQSEVEELLAKIWKELLGVRSVGRLENFFQLGGHSLLIMQMVEQLRQIGLSVDVRDVYQRSTLAQLAQKVEVGVLRKHEVPKNLLPPGSETIGPEMLTLVSLEPNEISRIVEMTRGGAPNIQEIYPLTSLQEGMLFHKQFESNGSDAYARSMLVSFESRERLDAFVEAVRATIERHDILRSAILWEGLSRPVQVVHRHASLSIQEFMLNREEDAGEQLRKRMSSDFASLNLQQPPLMRLEIAQDPNGMTWYGLIRTHHLAFDNESLDVFLAELISHMEGRIHELPEPVPYRNHVAQVVAYSQSQEAEKFFRSKLGDLDEPTAPFGLLDVHRSGRQVTNTREVLTSGLMSRLRSQSRRLSLTVATLFHAAWSLVVARTSGRDDIVFGTTLSGRLYASSASKGVLGMLVNVLPLRLRLEGVTTVDLVEQARWELTELLSHEHASLVTAQHCTRIGGTAPLFTSLLNYVHRADGLDRGFNGTTGVTLLGTHGKTNYPLSLTVYDHRDSLTLEVQADVRIDSRRVTKYAVVTIESLVEALEAAPLTPALQLPVMPHDEYLKVIKTFNSDSDVSSSERIAHELFEENVRRIPDATAVVCEGSTLSYRELNARANQLARFLRQSGVRPEALVALCVDRSIEWLTGLLAILKAGGAYVPLDVTYPQERLKFMLNDCKPVAVIAQERHRKSLLGTETRIIVLEAIEAEVSRQARGDITTEINGLHPRNLAYVIYTSGSTGVPKGVMVEHRNLVSLIRWHKAAFDLNEGCRTLCAAALGFDASTWEVWPSLSAGATLQLAPSNLTSELDRFLTWWSHQEVDVCFLATPIAELALARNIRNTKLRTLLIGGDRLSCWPSAESYALVNNYGPTESTVVATSGRIEETDEVLHIGSPITGTHVYILNDRRQPVPVGVCGEIHIGGTSLARGYLNRPEMTAERFIGDPFTNGEGERLYRTGDLARWAPAGSIEYLGRNDQQVKIRGFRVELGEIERQLTRHPQVKEAVVIAHDDPHTGKRLVAYVTYKAQIDDESIDGGFLRRYLRGVLPDHMVPGAIVALERLPLTLNGKLDRRQLPVPAMDAFMNSQYEAPEGEIEEAIAETWRAVLGAKCVGRRDNFFDLGGHSLTATRVVSQLRERLSVDLPIRALFDAPTIQQLAWRIAAEREDASISDASMESHRDVGDMATDEVLAEIARLKRELSVPVGERSDHE
jgi:amino acid adenylation domain-containing protein